MIWGACWRYFRSGVANKNDIYSNELRGTIRGPAAGGEALKIYIYIYIYIYINILIDIYTYINIFLKIYIEI